MVSDMATKPGRTIMTEAEINKAIKRMASEILESNKDAKGLVFIGILQRGLPLAQRASQAIKETKGVDIPVGSLDVSLYRDDLAARGAGITVKRSDIPFSVDNKVVILFDDVVFAGRTARAALDGLNDFGRAAKVQLAALIDRGGRQLPIQPDYLGKKLSVPVSEEVKVSLKEIDGVDQAAVLK